MTLGVPGPRRRPDSAVDPALQSERTAMAWQRTALGLGGLSALLLHRSPSHPVAAAPGIAGLVVSLLVLVVAERRYEQTIKRVSSGESPAGPVMIRIVTATSVALALAAVVLAVVGPG